jgi:hypothetical protein
MVKIARLQDDTWAAIIEKKHGMDTIDDVIRKAMKLPSRKEIEKQ